MERSGSCGFVYWIGGNRMMDDDTIIDIYNYSVVCFCVAFVCRVSTFKITRNISHWYSKCWPCDLCLRGEIDDATNPIILEIDHL